MQKKRYLELKNFILNRFIRIKGVVSVNLVGSFWENPKSSNYRDIDIVVILDKLSIKKFQKCKNLIASINTKKLGLSEYKIKINTSFGPLKFDTKNQLIFHLMVYDLKSHFNHVIKSPFTCFDWERTKFFKGKNLGNLLSAGKIQFQDFFSSRRGSDEYLKDLGRNIISYREYSFINKKIFLRKKNFKIKSFQKKEFYYHIVKNLIFNYYKLLKQKNVKPNKNQYSSILKKIYKKKSRSNIKKYHSIFKAKKYNLDLKANIFSIWVKNFVNIFQKYLKNEKEKCIKIIFLRHAKTNLNDNSFLGIGRDPEIIINKDLSRKIKEIKKENVSLIFSSVLRRSVQTAKLINSKKIILDNDLNEKNYGIAEGMNYKTLIKKFLYIKQAWNKKKDPKFPEGESDEDVYLRIEKFKKNLLKFLAKNNSKQNIAVLTHNVVLRCLIGSEFELPLSEWHKIQINHLEKIEFIYYQKKLLPNINREHFLGRVFK
tara:strand:- start:868 stop:2322 length:1455 start_codon:yes stop_codon:yes gene_type:complete